MTEKIWLEEIRAFKPDCDDSRAYLTLVYMEETDTEIRKITYPKVYLPFRHDCLPVDVSEEACHFANRERVARRYYIDTYENGTFELGNGVTDKLGGGCLAHKLIETVETKTKKMTVKEIEKVLGYKVEIVSDNKKGEKK